MEFEVLKYSGDEPYKDKNDRILRTRKRSKTIYPWLEMSPGDWFFVPVKLNQTEHSLKNSIRASAKSNGVFVKLKSVDGGFIQVIHDGLV